MLHRHAFDDPEDGKATMSMLYIAGCMGLLAFKKIIVLVERQLNLLLRLHQILVGCFYRRMLCT